MELSGGDLGRRWYLVEPIGSRRYDHVCHGMDLVGIFVLDHDIVGPDRWHTNVVEYLLFDLVFLGIGMSYQNDLDGSGKCPTVGSTDRNPT